MSEGEVTKLHDDEVDIDASLVTRLLAEQFPRWAGQPVRLVTSSGTDNVTFRVGPDLAVRLPRTARTQGQAEKDLTWLPRLAPKLPLAVPQPLALGSPNTEFPFSWGVYRWLPGTAFQRDQLADPSGFMFEGDSRRAFRDALKVDERAWVRARGWTLSLVMMALPYYRSRNPSVVRRSAPLIAELLADFAAD